MKLIVKVFGRISEEIGESEFMIERSDNIASLKGEINAVYPQLKDLKFAIAVNKKLSTDSDKIPEGAEIALLPPFSGG
ncbi:MoaD/ThiS family protein [Belliella sp. DSM 107340]|uniref:MoaD/ThiS family protein n=1 Tax=Belliella calami TaxID=2923436 RepID=A0ABS9UQA3_9BACT|nr:MoaD/ThiS family protein [Belliella calami]MCH7398791.1 MoaD/ThiS family protein [Belliella calami]